VTGAGLSFSGLALSSTGRTLSSLNPWIVRCQVSRVVLRMRLDGDTIEPHIPACACLAVSGTDRAF